MPTRDACSISASNIPTSDHHMAYRGLDPNRFASGTEAATVSARARLEQATVAIATERLDLAEESLHNAKARFVEAEAAYHLQKAALDDATAYQALARQQLAESLQQLATTKALLHPVRKTPPEILGMIFGYCLVDLPLHDIFDVDNALVRARQCQPFQLAAVCRRWREVSLSCPAAWTTLELVLDDVDDKEQAWLDYVTCILTRSASAPVDVRIARTRDSYAEDKKLVDLIHNAMPRCSSLFLRAMDIRDAADSLTLLLTAPSAPRLHTLHLDVINISAFLRHLPLLPHAPKLQFFQTTVPLCSTQASFPAMTCMTFDSAAVNSSNSRDDIVALAQMAPNLATLTLTNCAAGAIVHHDPVTLPLSMLYIVQGFDDGLAVNFVRQCRLPRLRWLKLCGPEAASAERIRMVAAILPHAPALTSLVFSTVRADDIAALCHTLRLAGALAGLCIRKTTFTHATLRLLCDTLGRLAEGDAAEWACPALTTLDLEACTFSADCAQDDIVQLVSRRLAAASAPKEEGKVRPVRPRVVRLPGNIASTVTSQLAGLLAQS
ncbi:hypothetical protein AURDEDRAFT_151968 [Auricularia subglabra TFB-10046 SS5]|nr:hypothetical protein AURDEDRAFT_151968 [Auricularia subglabra TFB-10046 SS5]